MSHSKKGTFACAVLATLGMVCSIQVVLAQSFPTKPVRFIVPYAPGGGTDTMARILATTLSERWRQQVVVDNRPGGASIIGTEIARNSPPDGHTFLITDPSFAVNPSLVKNLPYDPMKDFEHVTLVASFPLMLVIHPSVPAKSVAELIELARAKPGTVNYASAGIGTSTHIAAEILKSMAGIDMVHVPYKGGGAAVVDLIAGQTSVSFLGIPAVLSHVKGGKLRALAVTTKKRSSAVPEIPTVAESGLSGYEVDSWQGIFTPAGVPKSIVSKLQADLSEVASSPDVKSRIAVLGAEPVGSTPEQFVAFLKGQIETYARVIRAAGIRPE